MGKSIFVKIVLVVVILAAVAGLGAFAFRAGLAQGASQIAVAEGFKEGGRQAYGMPFGMPFGMPYGSPFGYHHFGMFGFLGCLVPLFFFFILFFAIRGLFWGGHRGWHHMHHGPWGMRHGDWDKDKGVPPVVQEWHRQMHTQPTDKPEDKK